MTVKSGYACVEGGIARFTQYGGDPLQYQITGIVAVAIVDLLEVVHVGQRHAQRRAGGAGTGHGLLQAAVGGAAVGQAGEFVVGGLVLQTPQQVVAFAASLFEGAVLFA